MNSQHNEQHRVYRLDRFAVPDQARDEFLHRVDATHRTLRQQPGFLRDLIIEHRRDEHSFILATLVEWRDAQALADAREFVAEIHSKSGFDPRALMKQLGIEAEIGNYKDVCF